MVPFPDGPWSLAEGIEIVEQMVLDQMPYGAVAEIRQMFYDPEEETLYASALVTVVPLGMISIALSVID